MRDSVLGGGPRDSGPWSLGAVTSHKDKWWGARTGLWEDWDESARSFYSGGGTASGPVKTSVGEGVGDGSQGGNPEERRRGRPTPAEGPVSSRARLFWL